MTKLAIFDLDGTLLNTVEDLGNATNHALTECGFPTHPIEAYYQMVGRGIYNLFRVAVPAGQSTEEVVQRMASIFIPYYDAHKCDFTRPYDGIPGMLKTITAAGVRLADLARRMIELSGAKGVEIKYTGLRDGEKLYEEVLSESEATKPSSHEKIRIACVREYDWSDVSREIDALIAQSHTYDDMAVVASMKRLVPEYISNHSKYTVLDHKA